MIFFVSCLALASLSGGLLNLEGSFASIGGHISKNAAFYVTIAFTFVCTGHTPAGDSPELMFVSIRYSLPDWKATITAMIAAMLLHACFVLPAFRMVDDGFPTPILCTVAAPLLLAGISYRIAPTDQQVKCGTVPEEATANVSSDAPTSLTTDWTISSTMVYSSPRIRCFDFRVLTLGLSITLFDLLCNQYHDEVYIARWPVSAVISVYVTIIWLFLEASIPRSRNIEPGIISLFATALVATYSHINFLNGFGLYDEELVDQISFDGLYIPDDATHSIPILIALWCTTLFLMVVVNRRLVQQRSEQMIPAENVLPPRTDHLLLDYRVKTSRLNFGWQLRNSRVIVVLLSTMLASFVGEDWPLEMNTTIAGLLLFVLIVGTQLGFTYDDSDEEISLPHVAALGFSALMTTLAIGLNRQRAFDNPLSQAKSDRKVGSASALMFYQVSMAVIWLFNSGGLLARLNRAGAENGEKASAQKGDKE